MVAQGLRPMVASAGERDKRQLVLGVATLMIAAQIAFRAWALYPSWFYTDDYTLMNRARTTSFPGVHYLTEPFNSHFMPFGKLLIWWVAHSGTTNWALAASTILVLQLLASCACLWMLQTLFGIRWANLALLAIYLTSAMAMPALMWWTACLTQLPVQLAFFLAVGTWTRYLRERRLLWCVLTALSLVLGLATDVRVLLVVPLLLAMMVLYFGTGRPRARIIDCARRYWPALAMGAAVAGGYIGYYALEVPPPFQDTKAPGAGLSRAFEVANSMLGDALTSGTVGGPWSWFKTTPPIVLAAPPEWAVHLSWVLIALAMALSLLRRRWALRGWLLMGAYAVGLCVLLVVSRGQVYGALAGMEYRYLTDMVCVLPLGLGLVFLELRGAPESSVARADPLLRRGPGRPWVVAAVALVCVGGLLSSVRYVGYWHHDNASRAYVKNLQNGLATARGTVDLANQMVPNDVMPAYTAPNDVTSNYVPLLASNARFPDSTDRLRVLTVDGQVRSARIKEGHRSVAGRAPDCGHRVTPPGATIPLDGSTFDFTWWMRIGYLSATGSPVTVSAGRSHVHAQLRSGVHSLFVKVTGVFDSVRLSGLAPGTNVCVNVVEVGDAVPGEVE